MADGDILAVSIDSTGWSGHITIEGWAGKQGAITYDYDPDGTPTFTFTVVSEGYTAAGSLSTVTRTVYATKTVRKPYPNEGDLDEVDSGSDLIVRFSLSDEIYDDDQDGGAGTSGTDPTVTIANDWAVDGGDNTAPVTDGSVTNNSTLDYPEVIGQWDWDSLRGGWRRVESDFEVGFRARHGFGIAMVDLSAIGASSSNDQNDQVTALSTKLSSGSGLYHEAYRFTATLSGYTQAEQIDLRAIAYPIVGDLDSVLDTNDVTSASLRIKGKSTCTMHCDKTGGLIVYAVVDPTSGSNPGTPSATLSTARADPYLTIGAAMASTATVIYVKNNGSPDILGSNPGTVASNGFYKEVSEDPIDTGVVVNRGGSFRTYETDFLCFKDIGVSATTGNAWLDGENEARQLLFDGVTFSGDSSAIAIGIGFRSNGVWFVNCLDMGTDNYTFFGSDRIAYSFTGCTITSDFKSLCLFTVIACHSTASQCRIEGIPAITGNPAKPNDNVMLEHNGAYDLTTGLVFASFGDDEPITNFSFIGNIVEASTVGSSASLLFLAADGSSVNATNNIVAHNTIVGERDNIHYNDTGTSANVRNTCFHFANSWRSYNIKTDIFGTPSGNRVGNWAMIYGCNYKNNRYDGDAVDDTEFAGLDVSIVGLPTVFGEMDYVDEQSTDLGGSGNGDYTPDTGSALILASPLIRPMVAFDQFGTPLGQEAGAVFIAASSGIIETKLGLGLGLGL